MFPLFLKNLFVRKEERAITYATGVQSGLVQAPSRTGIVVTELTALGISAVWCATKVISEAVGSLPLVTYQKTPDGGRDRAEAHPLFSLLHDSPNPEHTRPVFFETLMSHALLWGTMYAEIERDNAGNPIALWPIHPQYVQVYRNTVTGELLYKVTLPLGTIGRPGEGGTVVTIPQADMLTVPGISPDGSVGYSILSTARENIAYSAACDRFGQSFFGNMARLGGTLSTPNKLSEEARDNLKKSFKQMHGGLENVGNTAVLEEGLTYNPLSFSNEAGLYTDTRSFQIGEIARLFNVSPVKLHDLGRATWANLTTLNTDFYTATLRPWLEKIESEIERKLLGPGPYYVEFLADSYLRGDITTRYAAYSVALASKWLTVNEVRAFENLPPLPEQAEDNLSADETDGDVKTGDAEAEPAGDQGGAEDQQDTTTDTPKDQEDNGNSK